MAKLVVHPEADLASHPNATTPTQGELETLELFAQLKRKPDIEKFPNSVCLRRIRKDEVVCRQGEAGASAFYILTAADVVALKQHQLAAAERTSGKEGAKLEKLREEISQFQRRQRVDRGEPSDNPTRQLATAYLYIDPGARASRSTGGVLRKLKRRLFGGPRAQGLADPKYIPIDAPTDVDYQTRTAPINEGEIFGEMSCMSFAPRSATVVADDDCYMLEFLRNIFDYIQKDDGYRARTEAIYRRRVLKSHFSRTEFFYDVSEEDLQYVRERAHLQIFEPGDVICGEGGPSDCVYFIRAGLVQIVKGADVMVTDGDVLDWGKLCASLLRGAGDGRQKNPKETASPPPVEPNSAGAAKPGVAEKLAMARAKKTAEPGERAAGAGAAKPSLAEKLAMARGKKPAPPSDTNTAADPNPPPQPVASKAAAAAPPAKPPGQASAALDALRNKAAAIGPMEKAWQLLPPAAQAAVRQMDEQAKSGSPLTEALRTGLLVGLGEIVGNADFVKGKETESLRKTHEGLAQSRAFGKPEKSWTGLETRVAGKLLLRAMYPGCFQIPRAAAPRIFTYLSRGDIVGEIGVVNRTPRSASAIAYDHSPDASNRRPSRVEMVRIDREVFDELLDRSPMLRQRIQRLAQQRTQRTLEASQEQPWESGALGSNEFRDLGFPQGQKLLLIDLDRCTRCGDCVRACINTHDDGYTRLFLDGPRFDRFLVPSACRNCRNPACMIGCPVGSIQRGENGEILIRDWCIGCGVCATQCPYDSIQMHDVGIVPEFALGWQYSTASRARGDAWRRPGFAARDWPATIAPIHCDVDLVCNLQRQAAGAEPGGPVQVFFRYGFRPPQFDLATDALLLQITSKCEGVQVWLNDNAIEFRQDAKQKKRGEYTVRLPSNVLRRGENVLAVAVTLPVAEGEVVLSARLDRAAEVNELPPGVDEAEMKLVTERAVVCDLCSSLPSADPACVAQCPHDAAIRIDGLADFQPLLNRDVR